nr:MAG TPA: hypothetical protein [Caudoviricetes sp.]
MIPYPRLNRSRQVGSRRLASGGSAPSRRRCLLPRSPFQPGRLASLPHSRKA